VPLRWLGEGEEQQARHLRYSGSLALADTEAGGTLREASADAHLG
jgi:hypothetical protein